MVALRKQDQGDRSFQGSDHYYRYGGPRVSSGLGVVSAVNVDDHSRGSSTSGSASSSKEDRKGRISLDDLLRQQNNKITSQVKPHKANDAGWEAIHKVNESEGEVGLNHFKLLKRLGCGDIGSVYLAELRGTNFRFAMKVMDLGSLASRRKHTRAETERDILSILDHPFLPTLYAHFETPQFLCLVMEYCSGGDLHTLRQKQAGRCFSSQSARFYATEVLLALEYLHMMGVVYRDLKPENVLVRGDGHVMLSDFDLSLRCSVNPTLITHATPLMVPLISPKVFKSNPSVSPTSGSTKKNSPTSKPISCMPLRSKSQRSEPQTPEPKSYKQLSSRWKSKLSKSASKSASRGSNSFNFQSFKLPELVVEPTGVRSMSFVGTHEYLAPEIIAGEGHGSAVDWWTFGIFLYELLYGRTPFRGDDNEVTLVNVVSQQLQFPQKGDLYYKEVDANAKDLIKALLVKDPHKRLAFKRGATEIKQHPFFEGTNWALIRSTLPPQVPRPSIQNPTSKEGSPSTDHVSPSTNVSAAAAAAAVEAVLGTRNPEPRARGTETPKQVASEFSTVSSRQSIET